MDENSLIEEIRALVMKLRELGNSRWKVNIDNDSIHLERRRNDSNLDAGRYLITEDNDPRAHVWLWEIDDDKNKNAFSDYPSDCTFIFEE